MTLVEEETKKAEAEKISLYDRAHLKMISIIHDSLYRVFVEPKRLLRAAGLAEGRIVLEVGCGPGFFTVPAAEMIGKTGRLFSLDINPAAVERVRNEVETKGLLNTEVMLADASKTGLPNESIDIAFLFGVLHSLKDLDSVLQEMHRIMNKDGLLAVQKTAFSEKSLLDRVTRGGLFHFVGKESRIYRFAKNLANSETGTAHFQLTIED